MVFIGDGVVVMLIFVFKGVGGGGTLGSDYGK